MPTLKLAKFADDEGRLEDVGDAEFLAARQVEPETRFDFAGVTDVSVAYLTTLFVGQTPEGLEARIEGASDRVTAALASWARALPAAKPAEPAPKAARLKRPTRPPGAPPPARPREVRDRFTPTGLVERLRNALRGYIESAYPLSDPTLVRSRRLLLEADGGRLLAQVPYLETTTRYAELERGYGELGLAPHVAQLFTALSSERPTHRENEASDPILYPRMYAHQGEAYTRFLAEGMDTVIATGTGSGKTECFLLPILGSLYDEAVTRPASFSERSVRALILYPMNALVNDQLARLRLLFGEPKLAAAFRAHGGRALRFGMYTGRTPYPGPRKASRDGERVAPLLQYYLGLPADLERHLRRMGRYPAKDLRAFFAADRAKKRTYKSGKKKGAEFTSHEWSERLHTSDGDAELLTRHEMVHGTGTLPGHSPDILVTNYSMLEYMLMRPFERPIFDETARWLAHPESRLLLVVDEAHMYRGAKGAEVAFLIRRLRARLGIHDEPEKLRVIATSASLGSDTDALERVRRFAADMTGKPPERFVPITGSRTIPSPRSPGSSDVADLLASIDLERLHDLAEGALHDVVTPVLAHFGVTAPARDDAGVQRALFEALEGQPFVNQLIAEAAGEARSVAELADAVFGDHPEREKALSVLLALGALARREPDTAGLVPTRVHAMFRGLLGLHACINPACSGRQDAPGESALLGKLFSQPRTRCDACGCRVFEIASCRSCGSPYVHARARTGTLDQVDFLWGDVEGAPVKLELLPCEPRYSDRTFEMRVHLETGLVDRTAQLPEASTRAFFAWRDGDGAIQPTFERCAMCQPSAHSRARIHDFHTRGEQPFTALIEAQFAEQPPQKADPALPNHGRKVLVFSDGRQKAAKLAPALETSHAQDLFRQVLALSADALERETGEPAGMHELYAALVWVCATKGYDPFPSDEEHEFRNHLRLAAGKSLSELRRLAGSGSVRPTEVFAKHLFEALTDRYYSITALALGTVEENPLIAGAVFDDFPLALEPDSVRAIYRAWVRQHLERRTFRADGAALRNQGEGWAKPVGIDASKDADVLPNRFGEYLARVTGADPHGLERTLEWFRALVRKSALLFFEGDRYYLQPLGLCLRLRLDGEWLRCTDCGRIHPESLGDVCPACLGTVVHADDAYLDARTGFYRDQVRRAFAERHLEPFSLATAEHSAQLTATPEDGAFNKVEEYELRFQDVRVDDKPPIDVLSCTTTMEVGIDIGALSGVALRNVPPSVANYQQRAGRAGRRGRTVASVITYAHGTSHDAHYFESPSDIISGSVKPPEVYIENQQVLRRHVSAYLVQRFFHEQVPTDPKSSTFALFESLGTVEQFLSNEHPCSLQRFESWLGEHRAHLELELRAWVPARSHGHGVSIDGVDATIGRAVDDLTRKLHEVLPVGAFERRDELEGLERASLERVLEEELLQLLITRAVLPRYAFPTDVVSFWVVKASEPGGDRHRRVFEYQPQRDLQLALTEYAPGRSLTIDKWRFTSAALYSPYEPSPAGTIERRRPYVACRDCTFVSTEAEATELVRCPCCGSDQLTRQAFITPVGFAPDVNERRDEDRGEATTFAGATDRARLEVQDLPTDWHRELHEGRLALWTGPRRLAVVNKGIGGRGFRVCPECGRAEPEFGPGFTQTKLTKKGSVTSHAHPMEKGKICAGAAAGPFHLGHRFPTDALLLRLRLASPLTLARDGQPFMASAAHMALTSLVEAISLAASRTLQIDEGELSGWWSPVVGGVTTEAQLYLYDLLPGGAGYAKAVGESIDRVLAATEALLDSCSCARACYACLQHYGNNYFHASLDRRLALALLRAVTGNVVPSMSADEKGRLVGPFFELLTLEGKDCERDLQADGAVVPLVVRRADGSEVWVDVHHPLVDPSAVSSPVRDAADAAFVELVSLDAFMLEHDVPEAFRRLGLE
ncbi:MAG: DEAD/DEAH box helicase [Sandaracinaceae bacterium]|nr:DEAD/DEAH box helicase [Sandaracinaceae bacterium]